MPSEPADPLLIISFAESSIKQNLELLANIKSDKKVGEEDVKFRFPDEEPIDSGHFHKGETETEWHNKSSISAWHAIISPAVAHLNIICKQIFVQPHSMSS